MKLTNETVVKAEETKWSTGDYFVRKGRDKGTGGGLRRLVKVGRVFTVIAIDAYQTMEYPDATSADDAMRIYCNINGDVAKVIINEIKFEEVAQ